MTAESTPSPEPTVLFVKSTPEFYALDIPGTEDLILTFVDLGYLDTLTAWLNRYRSIPNKHRRILCLMALSDRVYQTLQRAFRDDASVVLQNITPVIVLPVHRQHETTESLWRTRVQILQNTLRQFPTHNVIMTDLDALWLRDPQPLFDDDTTDIVGSRGIFPQHCPLATTSDDGPVTVCFGFVWFRNSRKLRDHFLTDLGAYIARPDVRDDDQWALNCMLHQEYEQQQEAPRGLLPDDAIAARFEKTHTLDVTILSYRQVIRYCGTGPLPESISVAHCLAKKDGESKIRSFQRLGLLPNHTDVLYQWPVA